MSGAGHRQRAAAAAARAEARRALDEQPATATAARRPVAEPGAAWRGVVAGWVRGPRRRRAARAGAPSPGRARVTGRRRRRDGETAARAVAFP